MTLGSSALAVTLVPCSSAASVCVSVNTPAFDTAYALSPATGCTAVRLEMLTMRPKPPASICGMAARQHKKAEVRFRASMCSQVAASLSCTCFPPANPPATLTSTSIRPCCSTMRAIADSTSAGFVMSASVREIPTTMRPAPSSACLTAGPSPPVTPVTTATRWPATNLGRYAGLGRGLDGVLDDTEILVREHVDVALEGQLPVRCGPFLHPLQLRQQRFGRDELIRREDHVRTDRKAPGIRVLAPLLALPDAVAPILVVGICDGGRAAEALDPGQIEEHAIADLHSLGLAPVALLHAGHREAHGPAHFEVVGP